MVTTGSLSSWSHYALSFISASSGVTSRLYVNGSLNEKKTLGTAGVNEIGGLINGYIGALQASPSGSSAAQYAGKLNASLDDFRFWKTRRTSQQIYNNYYTHVGGGTNTDDANTDLGLYYKFNEGVVNNSTFDSIVLDYSGRIANGSWTGYAVGARNTGSAFVSSSLFSSEPLDPIIRSTHPDVVSLLSNLQTSGSEWDDQNTSLLYHRVPSWIREEDEDDNKNVKYLFQIIGSYFDTLYSQITELPKLKDKKFYEDEYKPLPFAERLLKEKGFDTTDLFLNSNLFEFYNNRDTNKITYEKEISNIKNSIYTNIYNNLEQIYKSKGTETSIRNMLRCFGVDDEIIKLNVYTEKGTHYFNDKYRLTALNKNYVNFNSTNNFSATIFQTSSTNNNFSFITGSKSGLKENYSAFTAEANFIIPHKIKQHETGYFETNFISSSIFGMHEAAADINQYTWEAASSEIANFQVYLVRDQIGSDKAKFVLTNRDSSISLESDFIRDIYDNQNWNVAVRVKPSAYPIIGNVVTSSNPTYIIDFYGVNHAYGTIDSEFHLSANLNYTSGSAFLTRPKRLYAGAHRTNFTGSVLENSDLKIGSVRFYLDYAENNVIREHNLDVTNYGLNNVTNATTMFDNGSTNKLTPKFDAASLVWDFATVTGSDSGGNFTIDDFTSGSTTIATTYPEYITKAYHKGRGFGFKASDTAFIKSELVSINKKQLPEIAYTSENITIEDDETKFLTKDDDVSDNYYSLEKSMYQVVSEEMLNMFSSVSEFSSLMGKAVDRYRMQYKNLDFVRQMFFDKVEQDLDFDTFVEYFKWIDGSISYFVSQLFPISSRHSKDISDVVESHILERNKYQSKFPLLTRHPSTEGQIKGSSELRYNWKTGHAPVDNTKENENCVWQKLRKERTDIAERETLRKAIIAETSASSNVLAQADGTTYNGSTFALRRLARPYKISQQLEPPLHGGVNYAPKKNRDLIYHLAQRHGDKGHLGQPLNVVAAGLGTGSNAGIVDQQKCDDALPPSVKKRVHLDVYAGRYSSFGYVPGARSDSDDYFYRLSELELPINIISQSVNSGYNTEVVTGFNSGSIVTNIHSDTVSPTNHIPMQGPFTQTWVGGHQHRHAPVNRFDTSLRDDDTGLAPPNNLDNKYTRPEAWMIKVGDYVHNDGAIGIVGPDYGGPYPDPARKVAVFYREERAKRPVNVKNIQHTTASRNLGNYKENYEIISAGGKSQNNLYLRKNPDQSNYLARYISNKLPETTNPVSLLGISPLVAGNIFGTHNNNRQPDAPNFNAGQCIRLVDTVMSDSSFSGFTVGNGWTFSTWLKVDSGELNGVGVKELLDADDASSDPSINIVWNGSATTLSVISYFSDGTYAQKDFTLDIDDGQWRHVIITFSGQTTVLGPSKSIQNLKIYVNGAEIAGGSITSSTFSSSKTASDLRGVAEIEINDDTDLIASYDDIAIFDSVLTAAEALELYNNNEPYDVLNHSKNANLVSYYPINSSSDTISPPNIVDYKGNNNLSITTPSDASLISDRFGQINVVTQVITSSVTNTVISSRFSAPGGIDTSPAYLDVYSREYSVHNALPFRNLSVRGSGSGESGTIRVNSHANRREGLRTLLSRHSGKFGIDSQHGSVRSEDYASEASFHKVHRNVGRRPTDTSTIPVPVFNEDHNNAHVSSLLPRSEFQYSWVTSSLGSNYSYKSGKQRIYGYTPTGGILSSSVAIGGESGFVAAINFPTASEIFGE